MVKLAQLQNRAANYVLYYARFAKSRLKFGLIEDVIQYNIALINFIITGLTFVDNGDKYDYTNKSSVRIKVSELLNDLFNLKPASSFLVTFVIRILMITTSSLSMWLGIYMTERFHEQLMTGKKPGAIRVLSLALKTFIELIMPIISMAFLLIYDMQQPEGIFGKNFGGHILPSSTCDASDDVFGKEATRAFLTYTIFPLGFTFLSHLLFALILNVSNQFHMDWDTTWRTLKTTFKFSIYSAALTIKYSRISGGDEQSVDDHFHFGWKQFGLFCFALAVKVTLPVCFILSSMPMMPNKTVRINFIGLSTSSDMIYKLQFPKHHNLTIEVSEYDLTGELDSALKQHRQMDYFFGQENSENFAWFDVENLVSAIKAQVEKTDQTVCRRIRVNVEHPKVDFDSTKSKYSGYGVKECGIDQESFWDDKNEWQHFKAGRDANDIVWSNNPDVPGNSKYINQPTEEEIQWIRTKELTWDNATWHNIPRKCSDKIKQNKIKRKTFTKSNETIYPTIIGPSHFYQDAMLKDKRKVVQDWVYQSATVCMWPDQFKTKKTRYEFAVLLRACSWFADSNECMREKRITIPQLIDRNSFEDPMKDILAMSQSRLKYNMINLFQIIQCHLQNAEYKKVAAMGVDTLLDEHKVRKEYKCGKGFIRRTMLDEISSTLMSEKRVHWSSGLIKDRTCILEGDDFEHCRLRQTNESDFFWESTGLRPNVKEAVPDEAFVPDSTVENWYDIWINAPPNSRDYALKPENKQINQSDFVTRQVAHDHMKRKCGYYLMLLVFLLTTSLLFSEMNLPVIPNLLRIGSFDPMYKIFMPLLLISFGVTLLIMDIRKSIYEFCAMNPSASTDIPMLDKILGCYAEAQYRHRNPDADNPAIMNKFNAMGRCGVGLRCFDKVQGSLWVKD